MPLDANDSVTRPRVPPVSYVTAVWLGMSPQDIARGIADGVIDAPPGWSSGTEASAASANEVRVTHAQATTLDHFRTGSSGEASSVDHDTVRELFRTIDTSLSDASFDSIWTRFGDTDDRRASNLLSYLSHTLLGSTTTDAAPADAATAAALHEFLTEPGRAGHVVDLTGKSGEQLAALAKGDAGYRSALLNLDSIAIIGNAALLSRTNANGQLDRFDPNTGEQNFSNAWLADRSKLLAWKLATEEGESSTVEGPDAWSFIDRRTLDTHGTPYELNLSSQDGDGPRNSVVFGDDAAAGELLKGGAGTDRIYAGGGDDVLRGNAGDDYLEGGRGDDLVMGGLGSDDLAGDQGSDELEGGSGDDRLRGGADDDILTGGRGNDRLEGGDGHDTYVIDPGDGSDTIVDADNDGEIQFDGTTLSGATNRQGNQWLSDDGRVRFSFSGDEAEGGALSIAFYRQGAAADAAPDNVTKITGWHNGDLGIVLGDGSAGTLAPQNMLAAEPTAAGGPSSNTTAVRDPGTSGNDGQGNTWIDPVDVSSANGADSSAVTGQEASSDDVASLFTALDPSLGIAPSLVGPDHVHAALMSWAGVREAPDVPGFVGEAASSNSGVTPNDLTSALVDLHDSGHDTAETASIAPVPAVVPSVIDLLHTGETSLATTHLGNGVGNLQRRAS